MNDYYKVTFNISPASADACDYLAAVLADEGFESFEPSENGDSMAAYVQSALYNEENIAAAVEDFPFESTVQHEAEFIEGQDWNSEWEKNYFKPIVVGGRVVVHSSFHKDIPEAEYDIVIDPRMAFGTGHHATTTLMMQAILAKDETGLNIIDMGTGTGILAILAAMRGAKEVIAIEIDPFAAENAELNVSLNLPAPAPVKVICSDASALKDYPSFAHIFLANINRNIITGDINAYAAAMKLGASIVVSGFYVEDRPIVRAAAENAGLEFVDAAEMDNWSSMTFIKK